MTETSLGRAPLGVPRHAVSHPLARQDAPSPSRAAAGATTGTIARQATPGDGLTFLAIVAQSRLPRRPEVIATAPQTLRSSRRNEQVFAFKERVRRGLPPDVERDSPGGQYVIRLKTS